MILKKVFFNLMCMYLNLSLIEIKKGCVYFLTIFGVSVERIFEFLISKKKLGRSVIKTFLIA